jgi:hypothetical protein
MGGTIFLGIREEDGTEHLLHTWTNSLPRRLAAPSFYNKGAAWVDLFARCADPKSPYSKRVHKLQWENTYGYVMVDMRDKVILSSNGYFHPGSWSFIQPDAEDVLQLKEIVELGWVTQAYDMRDKKDADLCYSDKDAVDTPGTLRKLLSTQGDPGYARITYCPTGYKLQNLEHGYDEKSQEDLNKFLADHNWKAK